MTNYYPLSTAPLQFINPVTGYPYVGAVLKAYAKGTTTVSQLATDATGATLVNSIQLNSNGFPSVSGNYVNPHISEDIKLSIYPDQDSADNNTGALLTIDNIYRPLSIKNNIQFRNVDNTILLGATGDQAAISIDTVEGSDTGAMYIGSSGVVTSSRGSQAIFYGIDNPLWSGLAIITPITPPAGSWTPPDTVLGTQWEATEGAPVVLEGAVITRGRILADSGHGLTVSSDNIWTCRVPKASIHALSNDLKGINMADFAAVNNSYSALILEGALNVFSEMWCKTSSGLCRQYFRNSTSGFVDSYIEAGFPAANSEYLSFAAGGAEIFRIQDNGDVFLLGKTSSNISTAGVEMATTGQTKITTASTEALRLNLTGANSDIMDFSFNGSQIGAIKRNGTSFIQIEYGAAGSNVIDTAGSGSPEGVLTAAIGSTYRRTDGGAGTSFYVKESGTGNTGWVAK